MRDYELGLLQVMLVDANDHMLAVMRAILSALGIRNLWHGRDTESAFTALRQANYDLVLTDRLATAGGLSFVRRIRTDADSPNPYLPIIMVTSDALLRYVIEAREAGVIEVLVKPVSPRSVYDRIRCIIEHPRPFIRNASYFGPDRRRHRSRCYDGSERRHRCDAA